MFDFRGEDRNREKPRFLGFKIMSRERWGFPGIGGVSVVAAIYIEGFEQAWLLMGGSRLLGSV